MTHDEHMRTIAAMAQPTDRCVTRPQILAAGIDDGVIKRLLRRGFLIRVFPGVYLVGVPGLSPREFLRACVLYAGPSARPSHRSGLELREVLRVQSGKAVVTTLGRGLKTPVRALAPMQNGTFGLLHIRQTTGPLPTEWVAGFETTLLPRTMVDLAGMEGAWVLRNAWREASFRSLLDPAAVEAQIERHRRPGNPLVRERMLNAYPVTRPGMVVRSRSGELKFLELIRELGLPEPLVNHPITVRGHRYELDFFFPEVGLAIETDGGHHKLEERRQDDEVRRMDFFIAGIDVLHIPNRMLAENWGWCGESVLAAYRRQQQRAA